MSLGGHTEALGASDVDVVDGKIHSVAGFVGAERFDGREDGGHAGLVSHLLQQAGGDEHRLDAFLHDGGHGARDHEGRVLNSKRVLDGDFFVSLVPIRCEYILSIVIIPAVLLDRAALQEFGVYEYVTNRFHCTFRTHRQDRERTELAGLDRRPLQP